jgi:hypothetical protein
MEWNGIGMGVTATIKRSCKCGKKRRKDGVYIL